MIKKGIIYILNFALIICIVTLSSTLIFSNTIFSKQYMISVLKKNNYYERIYYDIQDGFKNYIMQSGLEEKILDDLYDQEKVNKDIAIVLDVIYENKDEKIDTDVIRKTLDNRINKVLKENNRTPDSEEKEAIKTFEDAIVETYSDGIAYSQKYIEKIGSAFVKIQKILSIIQIGIAILIAVLLVMMIVINRNLKENVKTIGIALFATGILEISIKLLLGTRLHNILILNTIFSDTLVYTIKEIVNYFFIAGVIMAIIGFVTIVLGSMNKTENKQQIRKH